MRACMYVVEVLASVDLVDLLGFVALISRLPALARVVVPIRVVGQ